ncbi:WXG100 family type VII secretion target [Nocardioides sp. ChNu-153]|uniref:WXG100 family type VII secretion target n=1 Tax=unclassified Nocardioides TaxID=2615069 RepID=UPI002405A3F8|nr:MULTISPECIES: WXG100 family type VII secretion target [unclassified Nocardioides]MDF9717354.1 WXG100 family type VII secretion target [Nocardioides sp. ChNu-99]MDN7122395.1 WXG100 family type VII secretion target [Nocardioides sp. ChNu-153]
MADNMQMGEGTLSNAAQMVADAKVEIDQKCRTLEGQIQGIGARWGGQGAAAFHRLHVAWQEKQRTINDALNDFERSLLDTERDTTSTDSSQADTFSSSFSRLG